MSCSHSEAPSGVFRLSPTSATGFSHGKHKKKSIPYTHEAALCSVDTGPRSLAFCCRSDVQRTERKEVHSPLLTSVFYCTKPAERLGLATGTHRQTKSVFSTSENKDFHQENLLPYPVERRGWCVAFFLAVRTTNTRRAVDSLRKKHFMRRSV